MKLKLYGFEYEQFLKIVPVVVIILFTFQCYAQTLNLQSIPSDKIRIGFTFEKPFYPSNSNISAFSGNYELSCNIPLSSKLNLLLEVPYIYTKYEVNFSFDDYHYSYKYDRGGAGNVFIGLQTKPGIDNDSKSIATFGLFLPTADTKASYTGLFNNYYEIQKFVPNSVGLYFNYAHHKFYEEGFIFGFELGPNVFIPTKGMSDLELFIHYAATTGYQINKLQINLEFIGIGIVSQSVNNFGDRLINQLGFGTQWKETFITSKVYYKIYLKEGLSNTIDGVLGIGVSVPIN